MHIFKKNWLRTVLSCSAVIALTAASVPYSPAVNMSTAMAAETSVVANPIIWSDVPDPDVIRVGDTYYMVSTTMFFNPGAPIMK
ncbi:MAG: hypothetical protein K2I93_00120, partial [Oscillospiraceae bacterium]|nr:hypothetical protein [Oscillospiraceae bacterium]